MKEEIRLLLKSPIEEDIILGIILWSESFGLDTIKGELNLISINKRVWAFNKKCWFLKSYDYISFKFFSEDTGCSYKENLKSFDYFKKQGHIVIRL